METTTLPLDRIAAALDGCFNLTEKRLLSAEARARIFNAIDQETLETWLAARSTLVHAHTTLWQAVIAAGLPAGDVPTGLQILIAIEGTQS